MRGGIPTLSVFYIQELDISPGFVFQVAVTPTLINTSPEARSRLVLRTFLEKKMQFVKRFSPEERGCYFEKELPLRYLPDRFYRYEMSNCLFEAAYEEVISAFI